LEKKEILNYIEQRIDLVISNKVTDKLNYTNGILFHAIPNTDLTTLDWSNKEQVERISNAFSNCIKDDISFSKINEGQIGTNASAYTIVFNKGIIETFLSRIVKQTPVNFPPKIRYVQVENVVSQCSNFIDSLISIENSISSQKTTFTVFITLIGIKGVVFNATERDYTTTVTFPNNTLTFQINNPIVMSKEDAKEAIEEAMHKTLYEYEPIV
jgi:hypothetical protein